MSQIQSLLNEYGASHQNPTNKAVHWICVPAIMVSLFGLLWSIPIPAFFQQLHLGPVALNWAILFMAVAMIYYLRLSIPLAIGMLFVVSFFLLIIYQLSQVTALPLWALSLIIFAVAWVGQFWGQ
ncbi:MAG: Mpo1-like protein, partial [Chitinophagales bacterium]